MKTYDLHGYKLEEAMQMVESLIGRIRLSGKEDDFKVITGRGVIREALLKYLKENDIDHDFELGNEAVLVIRIE